METTPAREETKRPSIFSHTLRIDMQLACWQAIAAAALCCTAPAPAAAAAVETKAVLLVVADDLGAAGQA